MNARHVVVCLRSGAGEMRREFFSLAVGELHSTVNLVTQDAILRHQVCIAKPEGVVQRLFAGL